MNYCTDTWFILGVFDKDPKSLSCIQETKAGKMRLIIPMIVFAEATKKLMHRGVAAKSIEEFWDAIESSEKIDLINIDRQIAEEAAKVSLSYSVPLIDALVAATAKITDCATVFTADNDYNLLVKRKYLKTQHW